MSILSSREFQSLRQEAKSIVNKPELVLSKSKEIIAKRNGFKNWMQVEAANEQFLIRAQRYLNNPVFFWSTDERINGFSDFNGEKILNKNWLYSREALFFCRELLWKKTRIFDTLGKYLPSLEAAIYVGHWDSFQQLDEVVIELFVRAPQYVFINGYLLPFEELRQCENDIKELETVENTIVIHERVIPSLKKLDRRMSAAVFDFSEKYYWRLKQVSIFNTSSWSNIEVGNFVIDMAIEQVIVISPPEGLIEHLSNIMGRHLVFEVYLEF